MASQDEINSTLKNIVSNIGLLANSTAVESAVLDVAMAIVNLQTFLSTALATTHLFGGNFSLVAGGALTTTAVSEPRTAANAAITFSPANLAAASTLVDQFVWVNDITASIGFTILADGTAAGTERFYYVGYNP